MIQGLQKNGVPTVKLLLVGSGGREHALAWGLAQSPLKPKIYAAPGNAGIAQVAECVPIPASDFAALEADLFAAQDRVAVRLRFRGTHSGEFLGFPATGRTIEYVSPEFYRIADGLIAEEWICSDMATLFGQIS